MGDKMEVVVNSVITVSNPTEELLDWCEDNLTLDNPDYAKKQRMGFWTGNTPKKLSLFEIHGNKIVLPYGTLNSIAPMIKDAQVRSGFAEWPTTPFLGETVHLFDYQESAVKALLNAKYGILQSPAGSGKTQMGIELIKRFKLPALWLTHTKDLLSQSKSRAVRYMDPDLIGTITEGQVHIGKGVTFATIQTMSKLDLRRYRDQWAVVIVDEVHHAAGAPTMMTRFYKVLNALSAPYKFGLSATVHRADGLIKSVYALLGDIVYTVPDEAVTARIMKVGIIPIGTGAVLTEDCLKSDGTLDYAGMINVLCIDADRNRLIRDTLVRNADRPSLILSDRVDHLETLMEMLPENMRMRACVVHGKTKKSEREQAMEDMRSGRKDYLFATYALAREGLDIPRLEALHMTTPVKDEAVVIQSIGRVARVCEDKRAPVAFDYIDLIPYCRRAYTQRRRLYHKIGAYMAEGQL